MKLKAIIEKLANAKSTVMGIATMLGSILTTLNVVAAGAFEQGLAATGTLYDAIVALGLAISGVILLFSKDDGLAV